MLALFVSQRAYWIKACGTDRRDQIRYERHEHQDTRRRAVRERVEAAHAVQERIEYACHTSRGNRSHNDAGDRQGSRAGARRAPA